MWILSAKNQHFTSSHVRSSCIKSHGYFLVYYTNEERKEEKNVGKKEGGKEERKERVILFSLQSDQVLLHWFPKLLFFYTKSVCSPI
jgi:hypothetical protein